MVLALCFHIPGDGYISVFDHSESCRETGETSKYAMLAGYASLTQRTFRSFGRERIWTTLVFALTFCYTGLRAEVGYPYAQVMRILDEPRYQQKLPTNQMIDGGWYS